MRGISFSSSTRYDKTHPAHAATSSSSSSSTPPPPSKAVKMMKKLSTTFRRKTSVSPSSACQSSSIPSTTPSVVSSVPTPDATTVFSSVSSDPPSGPASTYHHITSPRAMTFSAPTRSNNAVASSSPADIPFFGDRRDVPRANNPALAVVRGGVPHGTRRPPSSPVDVTMDTPSDSRLSVPFHQANGRKPTTHVLRESNAHDDTQPYVPPATGRHRYFSFDADTARKVGASLAPSRAHHAPPPQGHAPLPPQRTRRAQQRHPRRRWFLPLSESPDKPRLFTPESPMFARMSRQRDKAEARTLVSACTYLEAEIDRIAAHIHTHTHSTSVDSNNLNHHNNNNNKKFSNLGHHSNKRDASQHCSANCAATCPLASYLPAAVERLRAILGVLEERYDTIEQVYVKSEEYARAMGRFFNMSPDQFNAIAAETSASTSNNQNNSNNTTTTTTATATTTTPNNNKSSSTFRDNRKSFR